MEEWMKIRIRLIFSLIAWALVFSAFSCGEKEDASVAERTLDKKSRREDHGAKSKQEQERVAKRAKEIGVKTAFLKVIIEEAGFELVNYRRFPVARAGEKGATVVYQSKGKTDSGGVIYLKGTGETLAPCWHWYFENVAPDSTCPVEVNRDGLWDIRILLKDGGILEFIQEETFTMLGSTRDDWIALNGFSSPATDPDHAMWKCFDGNTRTAWRSSLEGRDEVYMEVSAPLGIGKGILSIQTLDQGRPRECLLYADGKVAQQFTLENEKGLQKIRVEEAVLAAKKIRFAVASTYGDENQVSIAELSLE